MREVVKIKLGGAQFSLRPTFEAYGEIEAQTGKPLRNLYTGVVYGSATLVELSQIVLIGIQQVDGQDVDQRSGAKFQVDTVAQRLWDNGIFSEDVIGPISDYLAALGWTPAQRKKIAAELDEKEAQTPRSV
jgi:hypothetical protein